MRRAGITAGTIVGGPLLISIGYATNEYLNTPPDQISFHHNAYSIWVQSITNLFMSKLGSKAGQTFHIDCQNAASVNEQLLLDLLDRHKDTAYGKDHSLVDIRSREDFRLKHNITTHDDYKTYIDRVYNGENNVMFPEEPRMIGVTSGTSGMQRMFPVPPFQRKIFFTNGIAITFDALQKGVKEKSDGRIVWPNLQKSCKLMHEPKFTFAPSGKIKVGPNSSSPKDNRTLLQLYTTPEVAFEVQSENELLFLHVLYALMDKNLGFIESNFANRVLNFFVTMEDNWESLMRCIETGRLPSELNISNTIRHRLERGLNADPERTKELRRLKLEYEEELKSSQTASSSASSSKTKSFARRVWPNLHTILASETGTFQIYGMKLRQQFIGNDINIYSPLYAATEGLIGVNPSIEGKTYVLHPKTMFYEFIPIAGSSDDGGKEDEAMNTNDTLFIEELKVGQEYELIVTNLTGLYRYRLGDIVRCVGYTGEAPIVEFAYRKGQFLNVAGERTSEETLYSALSQTASLDWGFTLKEYTTVEYFLRGNRRPRYVIFVELTDGETGKIPMERQLSTEEKKQLDIRLGEKNVSYRSLRTIGRLEPIEVVTVYKGTFEKIREKMVSDGIGTTQMKQPRVTRKEELIQILEDSHVGANA